jgi:dTDP-4-dehydrorhamnose reductase
MQNLPDRIESVDELDEILSRPSEALVNFMKDLDGDLMILGAGGKIGPTISRLARRAVEAAGVDKEIYAVDVLPLPELESEGIKTITCDLLDLQQVEQLPRVKNIIFMVGMKFGSTGNEPLTWAINVIVPYHVARTFPDARIAAFSTGCVYPVMHVYSGGPTEETPPDPVGEYAMSCLGRERMFDYLSQAQGAKVVHIRLNYSVELRYGVLHDIASSVWNGERVDVTTGFANVIWQGDASSQIIQSLNLAGSPPAILNVTGPETFSVRQVALKFGELLDKEVQVTGEENGMAYINNASRANELFGYPLVPLGKVIEWTAHWIKGGGSSLGKPTHFETQDGHY